MLEYFPFAETLVGHTQQQETASSSAPLAVAQTQQVPNNRVEFVQHHNIDMVNEVVTQS